VTPQAVAASTLPLLCRALDPIEAINHTHQAPSAMRALARLVQPLLFPTPYIAPHLPLILEWSLPGIDPNDFRFVTHFISHSDYTVCTSSKCMCNGSDKSAMSVCVELSLCRFKCCVTTQSSILYGDLG
jgi:Proteasome-substrate-size regulator, mid region